MLLLPILGGCQVDPDGFTEQDRALIAKMGARPAPQPDGNPLVGGPNTAAAVTLGQMLFFDPDLSGTLNAASQSGQPIPLPDPAGGGLVGRVACADCHDPGRAFGDDRTSPNNVSLGVDFTTRNSPSLVNVAFYRWFAWDGRSDSLWMQCATAYESGKTMAGTRLRLARLVATRYSAQYQAVVPDRDLEPLQSPPTADGGLQLADGGTPVFSEGTAGYLNRVAADGYQSMAAYITQLQRLVAGIDAFAAGDESALSPAAKRGLKLFLGRAGCIECHVGSTFTDNDFHTIGIGQRGPHVPETDDGRVTGVKLVSTGPQSVFKADGGYAKDAPAKDPGQPTPGFRTKSLRNVANSPPYMHAGQLQSLSDVVRFYNQGGELVGFSGTKDRRLAPLGLTDAELDDLVAFLESLTGEPLPNDLTCDNSIRTGSSASAHRFRVCP